VKDVRILIAVSNLTIKVSRKSGLGGGGVPPLGGWSLGWCSVMGIARIKWGSAVPAPSDLRGDFSPCFVGLRCWVNCSSTASRGSQISQGL
jgi:hypothetical protein